LQKALFSLTFAKKSTMSLDRELNKRSGGQCELCAATENLKVYTVLPTQKGGIDESVFACATCIDQIENPDNVDL
jgi:protein PhnA